MIKKWNKELFITILFILLWATIGKQINNVFDPFFGKYINYSFDPTKFYQTTFVDFFINNLLFFIFIIILIYQILKFNISPYIIFILYPILTFLGFILSMDLKDPNLDFYFHFHHFVALITIAIFFNFISNKNIDRKKIFILLHYSLLAILISYFLIVIFPNYIEKIFSGIHSGRGEALINFTFFKFFFINSIQNSNGASRIIVIIIAFFSSYFFFRNDSFKKHKKKIIFILILLQTINIFYQSKLNIAFSWIIFFYCIFYGRKLYNYKKVVYLIVLILVPLFLNNLISSRTASVIEIFKNNRVFNCEGIGITLCDSSKTKYLIYHPKIRNSNIFDSACRSHNTILDKIFGGRVCGWEIIIKNYYYDFKLLGHNLFNDRELLKKYHKISSNSLLFALHSGGILSFITLLIFLLLILKNSLILNKISNRFDDNLKYLAKFYYLISLYLLLRCIFEDTYAFFGVDLLILIVIISSFNRFLRNLKN